MFSNTSGGNAANFEAAKEATRRATFLTAAARMTGGEANAAGLEALFRVCRGIAIYAGAAVGQSAEQVDAAIGAQCDADMARLKTASNQQIQAFARESDEIVKGFLAKIDGQTLEKFAKG